MEKDQIEMLRTFSYGDIVVESHQELVRLRAEYRAQLQLETAFVPPRFPTHLQIQTVGGCNASCIMCPMSDRAVRKRQGGPMPMETFAAIIREAAMAPECRVVSPYLQNEPLLDRRLPRLVETIKTESRGRLNARIVTNGSLLDRGAIGDLVAAGIDVISISVNAFTEPVYNRVMPGLDFKRTMRNIDLLLELNPGTILVLLTYMVTGENWHEVDRFVEHWSSRGVMCGAWGIGTMTGTVPRFDSILPPQFTPQERECFVPLETLTLTSDGTYLLCCSDWGHRSKLGRFPEQSLSEIWHSEKLSQLRRDAILERFDHEICQGCLGQTKVPSNLVRHGGPGAQETRHAGHTH